MSHNFPARKPHVMTPSQVMGHHRMMMQQGMSREMIASSMVSLSSSTSTSSPPFSAFEGLSSLQEERQRTVVENALHELQEQKERAAKKVNEAREAQEAVKNAKEDVQEKKLTCFLHKKPNKNCKKCQQALSAEAAAKEASKPKEPKVDEDQHLNPDDLMKRKEDEKKEVKCSPMLKEQIVNSSYFKRLLEIRSVDNLITEILDSVDTIDVYKPGSKISPSCFICHVYRLSVFSQIDNDLDLLIENRQHSVLRCVGLLYLRFVTPPAQLWDLFEEYLLDDMELTYSSDLSDTTTTIGGYVESLLMQEKYFDTPLPRLPVKVKQQVEEKVAPMIQHRKRMQANRRTFTPQNIDDTPVEVCMDGTWLPGIAKGFATKTPSRVKVKVRLESGVDVKVHLGKIVLADDGGAGAKDRDTDQDDRRWGDQERWGDYEGGGRRHRGRSRSRSRGRRGGSPDWSRYKGKSDAEMIQELRERNRDQAVCGHGKSYAKKPLNFDASMASTALANPAGDMPHDHTARARNDRRREDDEAAEEAALLRKRQEQDERQKMLATVYKKYCASAASSQSQGSSYKEVDTPDVMRLG